MNAAHAAYLFETQALRQKRGTFGSAYALPKDKKKVRLMALELRTVKCGGSGYLDQAAREEFIVLDSRTLEKAWFEWPDAMTVNEVTEKISGHFGASAHRVGAAFWIV